MAVKKTNQVFFQASASKYQFGRWSEWLSSFCCYLICHTQNITRIHSPSSLQSSPGWDYIKLLENHFLPEGGSCHWTMGRVWGATVWGEHSHSQRLFFHLPLTGINISLVQSLGHVWLFATPWTAARQASLSITNSQSLLKLMSVEFVMPSNHLILCRPLLLPPSIFPSIKWGIIVRLHKIRTISLTLQTCEKLNNVLELLTV